MALQKVTNMYLKLYSYNIDSITTLKPLNLICNKTNYTFN